VVRDRKIRTAQRTNQIVGFVTVPAWKKIITDISWYQRLGVTGAVKIAHCTLATPGKISLHALLL